MNRDRLSMLAHRAHPIAAPLSDRAVNEILDRAAARTPASVLDLGFGGGRWLVSMLTRLPQARGVGVDLSSVALAEAEQAAARAEVGDRVEFACADAASWVARAAPDSYDVVLCVGSTHALGGLEPTAREIARLVRPGGVAVIGDGYWQRRPGPEALASLDATEDEFPLFAGLIDAIMSAGFIPEHAHRSTPQEWDDYEWAWTSGLALWAADNPDDGDATDAAAWADEHRRQWLHGYLDVLGFAVVTAVRQPT